MGYLADQDSVFEYLCRQGFIPYNVRPSDYVLSPNFEIYEDAFKAYSVVSPSLINNPFIWIWENRLDEVRKKIEDSREKPPAFSVVTSAETFFYHMNMPTCRENPVLWELNLVGKIDNYAISLENGIEQMPPSGIIRPWYKANPWMFMLNENGYKLPV